MNTTHNQNNDLSGLLTRYTNVNRKRRKKESSNSSANSNVNQIVKLLLLLRLTHSTKLMAICMDVFEFLKYSNIYTATRLSEIKHDAEA